MLKPDDANLGVINGVPSNLTATTEDLARVRKLFSPAFSERALRKQEPVFQKYATLLMSKLRDLGDNGKPVEMTQLFNFTIFDAMVELRFSHPLGSETKDSCIDLLSGATYYMLMNPDKLQLLYQEVRCSFNNSKEITLDRLAFLDYLDACLKETLRIYPPIPIGTPRFIPEGGTTILE
ncbi:putative Cytochrome p450 monooxygenase [Seiridium cardinale]